MRQARACHGVRAPHRRASDSASSSRVPITTAAPPRGFRTIADRSTRGHADRDHRRGDRRDHVPGRVADVPAACRLDLELLGREEQEIGLGLGVLDVARVDDHRFAIEPERGDRCRDLRLSARRRDRPRDLSRLDRVDPLAYAGGVGEGSRSTAHRSRLSAGRSLRFGLRRGRHWPAPRSRARAACRRRRSAGPGAGAMSAARLIQRLHPRRDPRVDAVDQRAVKIEQDGGGKRQHEEVVGHIVESRSPELRRIAMTVPVTWRKPEPSDRCYHRPAGAIPAQSENHPRA